MPISPALKQIYASAPATERYIETLEFSHSRFSKVFRFVCDLTDWELALEDGSLTTFLMLPFKIVLPSTVSGSGNQDLKIAISNISRQMMDELEAANALPTEPVKCIYRVYIDTANSPPQSDAIELTIVDVTAEANQITAIARRADILNRPFPYTMYRIDKFPGLDR
jgi:hypothetical protein